MQELNVTFEIGLHVGGGRSDGHVMTKISRIYWFPFFLTHGVLLLGDVDLVPTKVRFNCGQQEEPAILISRLLFTHASHVRSQHSFGLSLRMYGMYRTHFDHTRLDLLLLVI